ncbi:MAG: PA2778 family cysteine peptidase [Wenzhouxiangellaceae bacterium]
MLLGSGCASFDVRIPESLEPRVDLTDTPFHPQLEHHCGPAALTTVLEASGARPEYEEVADRVYVPDLKGSLQVEMMATARNFDRIPFRVPGELSAVLAEVEAGHPVLILQNLRIRSLPAWHYAVVVGYDREHKEILMRSGTERELTTPVRRWMRQWDWASRWAIVVLEPGDLPAEPSQAAVFRALADFDENARPESRLRAWTGAAEHWPDAALVHMGLGNARYEMDRREAAADSFRQALATQPEHWPARLNLAQVLLELDRPCEGLQVIKAQAMDYDHPLVETHGTLSIRLEQACNAGNPSG